MNRRQFLQTTGAVALATQVKLPLAVAEKIQKKLKPAMNLERPARIFALNRLGFGPTGEQLASAEAFHFEQWVDAQLHPETIVDTLCDEKLKAGKFESLNKSLKDCWKDYKTAADDLKKKEEGKTTDKSMENQLRQTPIKEVEAATWIKAVYSEKQLQEIIVQFWHDHFNVNGFENTISATMVHYDRDVIRKHAFGNFRDFVEAVAKSPAMLLYLDNGLNQSANPNENFARELFELHTLGAENYFGTTERKKVLGFSLGKSKGYVDGDVYEAARAFTGWREDSNQKDANNSGEFNYYDAWHDRFQKIVLGHSIQEYQPPMKDGLDVITFVSEHEGTAHAISRKLCKRLICDDPPEALVQKIKTVFIQNQKDPHQLRKVIRAILVSPEFRDPSNIKLKRPFEYAVSLIRTLRVDQKFDFFPDEDFLKRQGASGQRLFQWKTPDGYPDSKERWATASGLLYRFQFVNQIVSKNWVDLKSLPNDETIIQAVQDRFLGYPSKSLTTVLKGALTSSFNGGNGKLPDPIKKSAVMLALMSPELQWK